jgi:phenylacetate-CoA ligase
MPLIRYRNEDLVKIGGEACPCGRGLPMMTQVVGRRSDIIQSPSGRAIHGEFFTHLFYDAPGIREFQVVQTAPADLVIRVVADASFGASHRNRIEAAIRDHADAAFRVRWETLAEIPRGASGKFRFTLSEVGADRGPGERT